MVRKKLGNEAYDAALYTLGAFGISMATKKVFKEDLDVPNRLKDVGKLSAAVFGGFLEGMGSD